MADLVNIIKKTYRLLNIETEEKRRNIEDKSILNEDNKSDKEVTFIEYTSNTFESLERENAELESNIR